MSEIQKDRYLSRFPTKFIEYLNEKDHYDRFISSVNFDYEDVVVYRGIHRNDILSADDFLNNIETAEVFNLKSTPNRSLEMFGVSVNEELKDIEFQLKIPNKKLKLVAIAKGKMSCKYGPASFDEDRPHHNWYLFDGVVDSVASEFTIIEKKYE